MTSLRNECVGPQLQCFCEDFVSSSWPGCLGVGTPKQPIHIWRWSCEHLTFPGFPRLRIGRSCVLGLLFLHFSFEETLDVEDINLCSRACLWLYAVKVQLCGILNSLAYHCLRNFWCCAYLQCFDVEYFDGREGGTPAEATVAYISLDHYFWTFFPQLFYPQTNT